MTELSDKPLTLPDGSPVPEKAAPQGIELDRHGDPVRQGSAMDERQSMERVIEGLKIASDAAAHLVITDGQNLLLWRGLSKKLDQARRACVQQAGLGLAMKEKQTAQVRGEPMGWRKGRERFREGLLQAAGGMRQIAVCHRGDFWWSKMATEIETFTISILILLGIYGFCTESWFMGGYR